jgi:cysteine desulfurase
MTEPTIYLDHHATTPLDPRVFEAMRPWFLDHFANAGSLHAAGRLAAEAVAAARHTIATALGCADDEIIFTSGATESCNLAIKGVAQRLERRGRHLVSVATEHPAVLDSLAALEGSGWDVTILPVDPHGFFDLHRLAEAIRSETVLVSVMLANNEVGTIAPLTEISAICRSRGVWLHSDATQAVGKRPVDVDALGVDLLSFSAHKLYGPKGIGALYLRRRGRPVRLRSQIDGGGQEAGLRSGTLAVPLIVGFAEAVRIAVREWNANDSRIESLRNRLWQRLTETIPEVTLNGPPLDDPDRRLVGNLNVAIAGIDAGGLLAQIEPLAASTGSACSSTDPSPSPVLLALGHDEDRVRGSVRFGIGRFNTADEIDRAAALLAAGVERFRSLRT